MLNKLSDGFDPITNFQLDEPDFGKIIEGE